MKMLILLLVIICVAAGCASAVSSKAHFATDVDVKEFVSVLRREILPGTSIADATAAMETQGFKCRIVRDGSFHTDSEDGAASVDQERLEGIDFILCTRVCRSAAFVE